MLISVSVSVSALLWGLPQDHPVDFTQPDLTFLKTFYGSQLEDSSIEVSQSVKVSSTVCRLDLAGQNPPLSKPSDCG